MFQTNSLTGMWDTDTIGGRVKSLDGNRYSQVFYNGTYFSETYLMAKKDDAGQVLKMFVIELGVPEELTVDGPKEQNSSWIDFTNRHFAFYIIL